jgi:hypothetical protein
MKSFVAITFHYLDVDFQLQSGLLDFKSFKGRHFGRNLAASLINSFTDLGIRKEQVLTITTDNASNNDTMIESFL